MGLYLENKCNKEKRKKKKILFVLNHFQYSNGVAMSLLNLANNLDIEKYDITILAIYRVENEFKKLVKQDIKVKSIFNGYFRGFDKIINNIPSSILYKLFVRQFYNLEVAFQFGVPTKMISSSTNKNIKRLCVIHTYDNTLKKYYDKFNKVVCVSKEGRNRLYSDLKNPTCAGYCYNILNDEKIIKQSLEEVEFKKKEKILMVSVGRLSPEKGYLRLLKCSKRLMDEGYIFELWIVGGGSEEGKLKEYINEHNLYSNIKLLGRQNNPHKYLQEADIFICSSFREGLSTAVTEAALIGIPIISTCVGGSEEIFELQKSGIALKSTNDEELYEAMKTPLNDAKILEEWKKCAEYNKIYFTSNRKIRKWENLLDELSDSGDIEIGGLE